jgi:hypothetical protein
LEDAASKLNEEACKKIIELKFGGFLEFPIKNMKRNVELVG